MKIMRVIREREGYQLGEIVRVGVVPSGSMVNPDYAKYSGMYWHINDSLGDVYFSEEELEQVHVSLDEILKYKVVYVDIGVQEPEDFFSVLGENEWDFDWNKSDEFDSRTKLEFFDRWYCTDTWVGVGVLSIDGERVALFSQTGRKNDCDYKWLSKEAKTKAKAFVKEFLKEDDEEFDDVIQDGENLVDFIY